MLWINECCENPEEDLDLTITVGKVSGCDNITETDVFDLVNSDVDHQLTDEIFLNLVNAKDMDINRDDKVLVQKKKHFKQ